MIRGRERAPTPFSFFIFTFGVVVKSIKEPGGASCYWPDLIKALLHMATTSELVYGLGQVAASHMMLALWRSLNICHLSHKIIQIHNLSKCSHWGMQGDYGIALWADHSDYLIVFLGVGYRMWCTRGMKRDEHGFLFVTSRGCCQSKNNLLSSLHKLCMCFFQIPHMRLVGRSFYQRAQDFDMWLGTNMKWMH